MVEHYRDEIRAGEELAKVLATEADKAKERQRQEEIRRQERAEEAERKRISNEQWVRDAPQREIQDKKDVKVASILLASFVIFFVALSIYLNFL